MKTDNKNEMIEKRKQEIESLLHFLEEEYRSAKISEETYKELKEKNLKKLDQINKKIDKGLEKKPKEELKPEKKLEEKIEEKPQTEVETKEKLMPKEEKPGEPSKEIKPETPVEKVEKEEVKPEKKESKLSFLKKIFKREKKEEGPKKPEEEKKSEKSSKDKSEIDQGPQFIDPLKGPPKENSEEDQGPQFIDPLKGPPKEEVEEQGESALALMSEKGSNSNIVMEIEKLKVIIDALKDKDKSTDERLATISENLGEMRSLVFQADGGLRETTLKLDTIQDEVSNIKPKEIEKRFREKETILDKYSLDIEMINKKLEDIINKSNRTFTMLKEMGSIENLTVLNKDIGKKIEEIKELVRYIERISSKTEKYFLDTNKSFDDFVHYKIKIDNLDEISRDLVKSMDTLNLKFDNYISKEDMNSFKGDIISIQTQIQNLNKIIPIAEINMPPTISKLKREKDDIKTLLDSIENEYKEGKITKNEYSKIKNKNEKKLEKLENRLLIEWKIFEKNINSFEKKDETQQLNLEQKEIQEKSEEIKEKEVGESENNEEVKPEKEIEKKPKVELETKEELIPKEEEPEKSSKEIKSKLPVEKKPSKKKKTNI